VFLVIVGMRAQLQYKCGGMNVNAFANECVTAATPERKREQ